MITSPSGDDQESNTIDPVESMMVGIPDEIVIRVLNEYVGIDVITPDDDDVGNPAGETWLDKLPHPEWGPVEWLTELPPSGQLMTELENLPAAVIDTDRDAVEKVAHWARVEAYAAAQKRIASAELAERVGMFDGLKVTVDGKLVTTDPNIAPDELSVRLGISRQAAKNLIRTGRELNGVGVLVGEALLTGRIDAPKADRILAAVRDLPGQASLAVQEHVLGFAGSEPIGKLTKRLTKACAAIDPVGFDIACAKAATQRRVNRPRALPNGMAAFSAVLPAADAETVYRVVDSAARTAKTLGDDRNLDQLRADSLVAMPWHAVITGQIGTDYTSLTTKPSQSAQPSDQATPDQPTLGGESFRVGDIGGKSAHVRLTMPVQLLALASQPPPDPVPIDRSSDQPGADSDDAEADRYGLFTTEPPLQNWCTDLLSISMLERGDPIPAWAAAALAADSPLARLVLDPIDARMLELTSAKYQPPPAMAEFARTAQPICVGINCNAGASSCDLNHRIPWPTGLTRINNLDPVCRRLHLLLTHGGWIYIPADADNPGPDAPSETTTATGITYRRDLTGITPLRPDHTPHLWPSLDEDDPPF